MKWKRRVKGTPNQIGKAFPIPTRASSENQLVRQSSLFKIRQIDRELYNEIKQENRLVDVLKRLEEE